MTHARPLALVTGAARRVGRSIARALAAAGHDVLVHYRSSAEEAAMTVAELESLGVQAEAVRADLAAVSEIEGLFGTIAEHHGRLDLLVNNASTFYRTRFGQTDEAQFDELLDSNLKGPFFCCQFAAPLMRESANAQIVNLLDVSVERPWADYLPYCAAKAGLKALTLGLARALAPDVRVNGVAPGPVLLPDGASPAERRRAIEQTLLGREGSPEDIAEAVVFLATGPSYVTGTVLNVDGGRSLA